MREPDNQDDEIERLFALAREVRPEMPEGLAARILADAESVSSSVAMPGGPKGAAVPRGWRGFVAALGGWPALGGLALATAVGVVIGINPPSGLSAIAPGLAGETVELQLSVDADPIQLLEG